jgi:hypothetical protein
MGLKINGVDLSEYGTWNGVDLEQSPMGTGPGSRWSRPYDPSVPTAWQAAQVGVSRPTVERAKRVKEE